MIRAQLSPSWINLYVLSPFNQVMPLKDSTTVNFTIGYGLRLRHTGLGKAFQMQTIAEYVFGICLFGMYLTGSHYVAMAHQKLVSRPGWCQTPSDPPASACQVLGLRACAIIHSSKHDFFFFFETFRNTWNRTSKVRNRCFCLLCFCFSMKEVLKKSIERWTNPVVLENTVLDIWIVRGTCKGNSLGQ